MTALPFLPQVLIVHLLGTRPSAPGEAEMPTKLASTPGKPAAEQGMRVGHERVGGSREGAGEG